MFFLRALLPALLLFVCALGGQTTAPAAPVVPPGAEAGPHFDPLAATNAYLATVPPDKKARSDAYFEGGYWLTLWDFLLAAAISILLLQSRLAAHMRDTAEKLTRFRPLQTFLYWTQYTIIVAALSFPLTVYEGFFREHQYGLANQNFGSWIADEFKGLLVGVLLGGIAIMALVGVVRRLPRTWPIWGALVSVIMQAIGVLIAPVFIFPLFNDFTLLKDPKIKDPILSLARANGIPATNVYQSNASKRSKRVSANVSGFLGTERVTLNDNLLQRSSPEAILAVMGHEMGHYVLHHVYKMILFLTIVIAAVFALLKSALDWSLARWGTRWRIAGVADLAVLPLAVLIITAISFVLTPFLNTFIRTQEYEADIFGLNAARQPDGFAESALLLGEYRKLNPALIEEWIFFDHPSGRTRIYSAMRWKAENLPLATH